MVTLAFADRLAQARRPSSVALCAATCGAKCCRGPGAGGLTARVWLTDEEAARLQTLADQRGLMLRLTHHLRPGREPASQWRLDLAAHGEACPFVTANLCIVYAERPSACRAFPMMPAAGCLVWPAPAAGACSESTTTKGVMT